MREPTLIGNCLREHLPRDVTDHAVRRSKEQRFRKGLWTTILRRLCDNEVSVLDILMRI